MFTVEKIAEFAHELNAYYCHQIGDHSQPPWDQAPQWQRDSAVAGVANIESGSVTTPADSHISWMLQKTEDGWVHGPVKDPEKKEHPCMVAFSELPEDQQMKDKLFFYTVQSLLGL